ncbi:TPA: hypothetical protein SLZ51_002349 [Vibrio cholerae]|uniref:hypothetical protein n=1 Tax=Vibrio cholerae TaxID=666 RepID=UPI000BA9BC2B|nr:hypothetical protein [Vibrio cholerae]PAS33404.1 hypothetical protein CGT72_10080 [Vibrio cholerae]HEJ2457999.1 hypothetical protein [Vibrio cholerae]
MAKRINNKQVKQMISDVVLQGRKAFWHGEESEVFAAKSFEQLNDYFGMEEAEDERGNLVSTNWQYFWRPCVSEKGWDNKKGRYITKGAPCYNKRGELINEYEVLPLICGVYGNAEDIAQLTTSYN